MLPRWYTLHHHAVATCMQLTLRKCQSRQLSVDFAIRSEFNMRVVVYNSS